MIDNYEELMQRVENEDRSTFIAQIEKNIYEWATHFEGLVIKSERDTFVLIFEQKYLSEIENKKRVSFVKFLSKISKETLFLVYCAT